MRRRLIITALVIDGLFGLGALVAAPSVLAAGGAPESPSTQYVEVGGVCVEQDATVGAETGGWTVDPALCEQS